jgi:rhodanese-related sulfurtransferase
MSFPSITPQDLKQRLQQKPATKIIDVRTPVEFREVHLIQAENIPLDRCSSELLKGKYSSADPIYVVCQSGTRAKQACQTLAAAGIPASWWKVALKPVSMRAWTWSEGQKLSHLNGKYAWWPAHWC